MSSPISVKKIDKEVRELRNDFQKLKQFFFVLLWDEEGKYRESFVQKMLIRVKRKESVYRFTNAEAFLKHIQVD